MHTHTYTQEKQDLLRFSVWKSITLKIVKSVYKAYVFMGILRCFDRQETEMNYFPLGIGDMAEVAIAPFENHFYS